MYAAARLKHLSLRNAPPDIEAPRATERLGQASRERPEGRLLWMHAAGVDQSGAALAVAQELARLRAEPIHALVTTAEDGPLVPAVASAAIHQLVPGETAGSVQRFLDHWRPDLALFCGMPDRPNLANAVAARGIPAFLAAAHRGTFAGKRKITPVAASLLGHFRRILAPSAADADALRAVSEKPRRIDVTGPLTDTAWALPCDETARNRIAARLGGRPVWLAAHATLAEIDGLDAVHRKAFRVSHRLLLVILPADPADGRVIATALNGKGWRTALRSEGQEPDPETQVFIADRPGEAGLWYRLAPISFIGGTFDKTAVPADPFEAAALGSAVLHGPELGYAPARFQRLAAAGAAVSAESFETLGDIIVSLLSPDRAAQLAHAGWSSVTDSADIIERLAELMDIALDESAAA